MCNLIQSFLFKSDIAQIFKLCKNKCTVTRTRPPNNQPYYKIGKANDTTFFGFLIEGANFYILYYPREAFMFAQYFRIVEIKEHFQICGRHTEI